MGFQQEIRNAVARAACRLSQPDAIGEAFGIPENGVLFPESVGAFREWVCDYPGNDEDKGQYRPGSPGKGGKCPVQYTMNIEVTDQIAGGGENISEIPWSAVGPLSNLRVEVFGGGSGSRVLLDTGTGTQTITEENFGNRQTVAARFLSITRVDGLPDDCGFIEPPIPPEWDDEIPDEDPENPPRPITIIPIIPIVLPGGGLSFPFTVNGPNFTFNTTLRVGGGGGGGGNDCEPIQPIFGPRRSTEPIGSENIPEVGDNEPPEPPEGEEEGFIIGCFVAVNTRADASATVIGGTAGFPELLIPRVADISFAVIVEGKRAWTADIPVKFDKQWVPVPGKLLAYDVRIKPEPGVNALYFPLRVTEAFKIEHGYL